MEQSFATILIDPNIFFLEGLAAVLATTRYQPRERLTALHQLTALDLPIGTRKFFLVDLGSDAEVAADGVRQLKTLHPDCVLMILTERYDQQHMWAIIRAGANGYLVKTTSPEVLVNSLDLALLGIPVFPAAALEIFTNEAAAPLRSVEFHAGMPRRLTDREAGILGRLTVGESNKLIARRFDIAEATVKVHIKAILRKIQVKNRTQAAVWAIDNGICAEIS